MALVNRAPRGSKCRASDSDSVRLHANAPEPGHGDTFVPQDQAFLAGFKFAKKSVFVWVVTVHWSLVLSLTTRRQTPTFNATPVVEAALDAVRRGVLVEIYADLGFNDEVSGGRSQRISTHPWSYRSSMMLTHAGRTPSLPGRYQRDGRLVHV